MNVFWYIVLGLVVLFLAYKIVRGLILTARCKRIFKMQQKKLKESGLLTENHVTVEEEGDDAE
jgi:hypothetical protein